MSFISPQELRDASVDAGTLEKFTLGGVGEPNVNRAGDDVSNLATINDRALEVARQAANMQTYLTYDSPSDKRMVDDVSQVIGTIGRVTADPDSQRNGDYTWAGSQWVWSGVQPANRADVDRATDLAVTATEIASLPGEMRADFFVSDSDAVASTAITDEAGQSLLAVDAEGYLINQTRGEFYGSDEHIAAFAITDGGGRPVIAVDDDRQLIVPWLAEFFSSDAVGDYAYIDDSGVVFMSWLSGGEFVIGGGGQVDWGLMPFTEQGVAEQSPWNDRGSIAVRHVASTVYKSSTLTLFPTAASVYAYLDALMAEFPDYISSAKIGEDRLGNAIMMYRAKPSDYLTIDQGLSYPSDVVARPKLILISGTHGDETHCVSANVALFGELCRQWRELDRLDQLRWGVDLVFVPVVNPSGYNARTRRNSAGVDLNRNFPTRWVQEANSGPSAASEPETQAIIQLMSDHDDAISLIDHHRMFLVQNGTKRIVWVGAEGDANIGVGLNALNASIAEVKRRYPFVLQDNSPVGAISALFNGSMALHATELIQTAGFLLETPDSIGGTAEQTYVHARRCVLNLIWEVYQKELAARRTSFPVN